MTYPVKKRPGDKTGPSKLRIGPRLFLQIGRRVGFSSQQRHDPQRPLIIGIAPILARQKTLHARFFRRINEFTLVRDSWTPHHRDDGVLTFKRLEQRAFRVVRSQDIDIRWKARSRGRARKDGNVEVVGGVKSRYDVWSKIPPRLPRVRSISSS